MMQEGYIGYMLQQPKKSMISVKGKEIFAFAKCCDVFIVYQGYGQIPLRIKQVSDLS